MIIGIYVTFTFSTAEDIELGPLAEKSATPGDNHFPITVFGILSLAIGDLKREMVTDKQI